MGGRNKVVSFSSCHFQWWCLGDDRRLKSYSQRGYSIHMENQTWSSSNSLSKRNTIKRYRTLFTQTKSVFPVTWVTLLLHTDPRTFYTTPDWFKHNVAETIILFKCLLLCFLTMNINQITACNLFWLHKLFNYPNIIF